MTTRRQFEHESGYYEDAHQDYELHSSLGAGSKRQRLPSGEIVGGGGSKNKRQKISVTSQSKRQMGLAATTAHQQLHHASSKTHMQHISCNNNNNNNNNVKRYDFSLIPVDQVKKSAATAASTVVYSNNNHPTPASTKALPITEVVEVRDSESDEEAQQRVNVKNGTVTGKIAVGATTAFVVGGSSSSTSVASSTTHNHNQQQKASEINGGTQQQHKDAIANADLERMQREIEEVTQVHTKCKLRNFLF